MLPTPRGRLFARRSPSARLPLRDPTFPKEDSMRYDPTTDREATPIAAESGDSTPQTTMRVTKRNGHTEPVDLNKIVRAVHRSCRGLPEVDAMRVATKTISGLYDGATTAELDKLSIQTAAELIGEEPQYSKLAARLLAAYVDKEVRGQAVASFSQSIRYAHQQGLIGDA